MAKNLERILSEVPPARRKKIDARAKDLATLKDLRQAVEYTQADLALALGVGQDTISRIEHRSDLLLSTVRKYVEAMGGTPDLVARFPHRPAIIIDHLVHDKTRQAKRQITKSRRVAAK